MMFTIIAFMYGLGGMMGLFGLNFWVLWILIGVAFWEAIITN